MNKDGRAAPALAFDTDAAIDAIAAEVRGRLPAVHKLADVAGSGGMGPDVTIPAIWMSLLLTDRDLLKARAESRKSEAILRDRQLAASVAPRARPVTEDDVNDYSAALGQHAVNAYGRGIEDRIGASQVLFQAAIAVLLTALPAEAVLDAIERLPEIFEIRAKLGIGEVRQ